MNPADWISRKLYKWVILNPPLRKLLNGIYFNLLKKPQYHIALRPGDTGSCALLTDDPAQVPHIASFLENPVEIAWHREYRTFRGYLGPQRIIVISTGLGGPSTAIAIEELASIGIETCIYLGKGYDFNPPVNENDLILVKGAARDEGTGLHYLPLAFPAIADFQLTATLNRVCRDTGWPYHTGIVHSRDAYYLAPGDQSQEAIPALCADLNSAACFTVASSLGVKMGILLTAGSSGDPVNHQQVLIAIKALKLFTK